MRNMLKCLFSAIRFGSLLCGICVVLLLIGCSKQLTRSHALDLITHSENRKATVSFPIVVGQYALEYPADPYPAYVALQSFGLLAIKDNPPITAWYDVTKTISAKKAVDLTNQGQSQASKETDLFGNIQWSFITAEDREVVAVTGIGVEGETEATAQFTWKWKLSTIGQALAKAGCSPDGKTAGQGKDTNPLREGTAEFKLYDDGWRLEQIEFL